MVHRINLVRFTRKSFASETLAPSAASIAGKIQYVRVRHPNVNYVRMEVFCRLGCNFLYDKKAASRYNLPPSYHFKGSLSHVSFKVLFCTKR